MFFFDSMYYKQYRTAGAFTLINEHLFKFNLWFHGTKPRGGDLFVEMHMDMMD